MVPSYLKEESEQKEVLAGNLVEVGEFTNNIGDITGSRFS